MHESARSSACGLRRLLCLCALGSCSSGFLFWQRVWCAFILSVVRQLLRLSWLRVLQLLPELLWLWLGRLLSALVAGSVLRRVLWRVAKAGVGRRTRRTRLAWRRMARPSLTRSLGQDARRPSPQHARGAFDGRRRSISGGGRFSALSLWRTIRFRLVHLHLPHCPRGGHISVCKKLYA
jgi:hypothetical protein